MNMKKLIESMDHIEECGMNEDPMPTAMPSADAGQPVSMNVSINASGKDHVADLIDMMKNAGMSAAEPVSAPSLGMRGDMEKFRSAMDDDPKIPGDDDNPDDQDLKAGPVGTVAGGLVGLPLGPLGALTGAAAGDSLTDAELATEDADPIMSMIAKFEDAMDKEMGYYGSVDAAKVGMLLKQGKVEDAAGEMADAMADQDGGSDKFDIVMQTAQDYIEDYMANMETEAEDDLEEYANEPDPQYGDMSDAIPDGNDLNRKKKAYPATQDGDNPMAVENIKATLMAALAEKKKPDADGDGVPDWADKKPGKDDNADKKAKKGTDESGQTKDCPKCGAPGKKKLMACSTCGCS